MAIRVENIYKRKDGRWEGRYKAGYDENGKSKYHSVYGKTYQAVRELLTSIKTEPAVYQKAGKLTVKELFEEFMAGIKLRVKESTYANYRMKADKHILPAFGGVRFENLTTKMLHIFIQKKLNSGLSAKYVSDIVIVFKSMTKYISMVHGFHNPIANAVLPKTQKKEMFLFSEEQQKTLCSYLIQNQNSTSLCVLLSLYTGLRVGEVCALRWSDIDFEKSILTVSRTVQRIQFKEERHLTKLMIGTPKSQTSLRSIPIPSFLMHMLKQMKNIPESYVLSGTDRVSEPRTMQYRFKAILKKTGLPDINYHSLRHMFATNCI
ncbi:MAG: site-specific integrase, partial [Oscillospiraceae bacterium]|nr:site-specific integrase [Oscillospiraceae bacterium]